jgi:hypothetical protein
MHVPKTDRHMFRKSPRRTYTDTRASMDSENHMDTRTCGHTCRQGLTVFAVVCYPCHRGRCILLLDVRGPRDAVGVADARLGVPASTRALRCTCAHYDARARITMHVRALRLFAGRTCESTDAPLHVPGQTLEFFLRRRFDCPCAHHARLTTWYVVYACADVRDTYT